MTRLETVVAMAAVILLTVLSYRSTLSYGFVYEDRNAAVENAAVRGEQPIDFTRARWLSALSHRMNYWMTPERASSFHATNLTLHILNSLWVFAIGSFLAGPLAGLVAMAVFSLHWIQSEAVAYVASRSELLATFFALQGLWLSMVASRRLDYVAAWASVVLAVCAKESSAVIVPLMAMIALWRGRRVSPWWAVCLLLPIAGMAYSVLRLDYTVRAEMGTVQYIAMQWTAIWRYVFMLVVPFGQSVDHDFDAVATWARYVSLAGGLMVVAWAAYRWHLRRLSEAVFAVTWVALALSPRFVMRIPEYLNEHQMYLPMVGISIAIGMWVASTRPQMADDEFGLDLSW